LSWFSRAHSPSKTLENYGKIIVMEGITHTHSDSDSLSSSYVYFSHLKSFPRLQHISCIFHDPFVPRENNEFFSLSAVVVAAVSPTFGSVGRCYFCNFRAILSLLVSGPQRLSPIFHFPTYQPLATISHCPFAVSC